MMAPESERACTKCGHPRNAHDMEQPYQCFHLPEGAFEYSCDCDGFSYAEPAPSAAENTPAPHETSEGQANPNEPTLACSEVVERLATEAMVRGRVHAMHRVFSREKALAILDSWRERRVQELEELLAKHSLTPELSSTPLDTGKEK